MEQAQKIRTVLATAAATAALAAPVAVARAEATPASGLVPGSALEAPAAPETDEPAEAPLKQNETLVPPPAPATETPAPSGGVGAGAGGVGAEAPEESATAPAAGATTAPVPATPPSSDVPLIHVTIGRIEVRAVSPPPPQRTPVAPSRPSASRCSSHPKSSARSCRSRPSSSAAISSARSRSSAPTRIDATTVAPSGSSSSSR